MMSQSICDLNFSGKQLQPLGVNITDITEAAGSSIYALNDKFDDLEIEKMEIHTETIKPGDINESNLVIFLKRLKASTKDIQLAPLEIPIRFQVDAFNNIQNCDYSHITSSGGGGGGGTLNLDLSSWGDIRFNRMIAYTFSFGTRERETKTFADYDLCGLSHIMIDENPGAEAEHLCWLEDIHEKPSPAYANYQEWKFMGKVNATGRRTLCRWVCFQLDNDTP